MVSINLHNLPEGPFRLRAYLTSQIAPEISRLSIDFIEQQYESAEHLQECVTFMDLILPETPTAEVGSLFRLWFFPWLETQWEFDMALVHTLHGRYKAAHDHLRRALELPLVAAYFLSSASDAKEAQYWLSSVAPTPFFSKALSKLCATNRWARLITNTDWPSSLKKVYSKLSDVIHVRGRKGAYMSVQPSHGVIQGHHVPEYSEESLQCTLDLLIEVARNVAVILVLTNPTLIIGLPVEEKFGLNPPASGLLNEGEAEILKAVIPEELLQPLQELAANDDVAQSLVAWVGGLPDITPEELAEQAKQLNRDFGDKNRESV